MPLEGEGEAELDLYFPDMGVVLVPMGLRTCIRRLWIL